MQNKTHAKRFLKQTSNAKQILQKLDRQIQHKQTSERTREAATRERPGRVSPNPWPLTQTRSKSNPKPKQNQTLNENQNQNLLKNKLQKRKETSERARKAAAR